MPVILIEAFVRLAVLILDWFVNKKTNNEKLKKAFQEFAELARAENIKTIKARKDAEKQLSEADKEWSKLEEKKPTSPQPPKP